MCFVPSSVLQFLCEESKGPMCKEVVGWGTHCAVWVRPLPYLTRKAGWSWGPRPDCGCTVHSVIVNHKWYITISWWSLEPEINTSFVGFSFSFFLSFFKKALTIAFWYQDGKLKVCFIYKSQILYFKILLFLKSTFAHILGVDDDSLRHINHV